MQDAAQFVQLAQTLCYDLARAEKATDGKKKGGGGSGGLELIIWFNLSRSGRKMSKHIAPWHPLLSLAQVLLHALPCCALGVSLSHATYAEATIATGH